MQLCTYSEEDEEGGGGGENVFKLLAIMYSKSYHCEYPALYIISI